MWRLHSKDSGFDTVGHEIAWKQWLADRANEIGVSVRTVQRRIYNQGVFPPLRKKNKRVVFVKL